MLATRVAGKRVVQASMVRPRSAIVLSLRWYLLALTAAAMLPMLLLAAVEAREAIQARRSRVDLQMQLLLSAGAAAVEQGLDALTATATLLALSPSLASRDLAAFRQEADELATTRQVDAVLRDPAGNQVVATRVPRGAPLPSLPPEDAQARHAIGAGRSYVSDVYTSGMTHPFLTRVVVPARFGTGKGMDAGYSVELGTSAETVTGWIAASAIPAQWGIFVVGGNGLIVTHYPNAEAFVGRGTATDVFEAEGRGAGRWAGFDLDGQPLDGVFQRLPGGWSVVVCAPASLLAQPTRMAMIWLAAVAIPLLLGGLAGAILLARRINRSVDILYQTARALGEGRPVVPHPLPVSDLAFVQEALCSADAEIAARQVTEQTLSAHVRSGLALMQSVVDGSTDLIFARDIRGHLLLANESVARLLATDGNSDKARAAAVLSRLEEDALASVGERLFEVGHSVLRDPNGGIAGTISIARDVTERIEADTRMRRLQSDLVRAGRLSAVAAMGAGLAHELHQPLSAAANFMAVALRRLSASPVPPEITGPIAAAVSEASAQVLRTGEIVKRLRGFIGETAMQDLELAGLVREAAEAAWRYADPGQARLHLQLDESLHALADTVSIQQVVSNLVRNAAQAVGNTGDVWVVLDADETGSSRVSVLDTGPGIDLPSVERLFDVFGGSSKEDGLGVGLAICRTIVAAHGGWITATNHAGGGAAFCFTLPPRPPGLLAPTERQAA